MDSKPQEVTRDRAPYEPPRIEKKRSVAQATLQIFSGTSSSIVGSSVP